MPEHVTSREPIREVAAAWYDQVHRDDGSAGTRAAFDRWLAASSEHCAAFEEIGRNWSSLKSAAHDPEILALRHETALRLTRSTSKHTRVFKWSVAAAAAVVLSASLVALNAGAMGERSLLAQLADVFRLQSDGRYVTVTGERLSVTLNDGSQLTLNTQSEVAVAFSQSERTVRHIRGQAIFEVEKDPARPFVVEAQQRRLPTRGSPRDGILRRAAGGSVAPLTWPDLQAGAVR